MNAVDNIGVFAVPCDRVMIISTEQAKKILKEIEESIPTSQSREKIRREAEALRRKPTQK